MSTPINDTTVREEIEAFTLDQVVACAGTVLELETIYGLGATTGMMRNSLPADGYMHDNRTTCEALIARLAKEISSGEHSVNKTQVLYRQYYQILKLKRVLDLYLRDKQVLASISLDYDERSLIEQKTTTANDLQVVMQEDD